MVGKFSKGSCLTESIMHLSLWALVGSELLNLLNTTATELIPLWCLLQLPLPYIDEKWICIIKIQPNQLLSMSLYSYDGLGTFIDMGSSRVQERSTQWDNYIIRGHFLKYQVKLLRELH